MSRASRGVPAHRLVMPAVAVVAIFGTYGVTSATGVWQSSGRTEVTSDSLAPADLKGWMTVQQASDGLGVDIPTLLRLAGADAATAAAVTPDTPLNQLEATLGGFSMEAFRAAVTAHLTSGGAPAPSGPSPSALPSTGASGGSASPHPSGTGTGSRTGAASPSGTGSASGVTGQMTLAQVASAYGMALPDLLAKAGLPADAPTDVPLRTLKDRYPDFEIATVRTAVGAG
ncbi:MAG: hypothetical protein LCH98_18280 [Actinobacteria bacterium]|nr:hypothetical protein [Actinomycetota bacterium]